MQECKSIFIYKILTLIAILALLLVGVNVSALTTVQTPSIISIKQYSADKVIKNCTNTNTCDYSSDSTNLQYVQTTYNYNFTKGKRYKIQVNGYYRWGSPISMNPEFQHLREERVAFTAPYFSIITTQCYIKVTDYVVEDSTNYNEVSQMSYNVEYTCEFSPETNFTSIAFMTLTDATLLTSNLTIMSSGMTVEEVVNNQDIINNANNNQGQTNQRLDEVNDNLSDINDALTDSSAPDMGALNDTAGWLPPGPLDSIINLPLTIINSLTNLFSGGQCQPVQITLPFVNKTGELPCLNSLYEDINGLNVLFNVIFGAIGGYILYKYLVNLYVWVEKAIMMKETGYMNDWGGV